MVRNKARGVMGAKLYGARYKVLAGSLTMKKIGEQGKKQGHPLESYCHNLEERCC